MAVAYPVGYPIIDPKVNYLNYDLLAYLDQDLPETTLCFYLEFASRLTSGENVNARNSTKSHIGAVFFSLLTINIPHSFSVVVIIDILYALFANTLRDTKPSSNPETHYNPEDRYSPTNYDPKDIFPPGVDVYFVISGNFEKEDPRASTWFYYLLRQFQSVPAWVVPVLAFIVLTADKITGRKKDKV
ncbi:MAG: hypothetical protein FWG14_08885 [Peptococcaceae bacterium]|nr:hypothetical protein [Peptococcaceae bacterium]